MDDIGFVDVVFIYTVGKIAVFLDQNLGNIGDCEIRIFNLGFMDFQEVYG